LPFQQTHLDFWPLRFEFPVDTLPVQVQQALQNKVNLLHPKNRYVRGLLLQTLCMEAVKIKSHPDHGQNIKRAPTAAANEVLLHKAVDFVKISSDCLSNVSVISR